MNMNQFLFTRETLELLLRESIYNLISQYTIWGGEEGGSQLQVSQVGWGRQGGGFYLRSVFGLITDWITLNDILHKIVAVRAFVTSPLNKIYKGISLIVFKEKHGII